MKEQNGRFFDSDINSDMILANLYDFLVYDRESGGDILILNLKTIAGFLPIFTKDLSCKPT